MKIFQDYYFKQTLFTLRTLFTCTAMQPVQNHIKNIISSRDVIEKKNNNNKNWKKEETADKLRK